MGCPACRKESDQFDAEQAKLGRDVARAAAMSFDFDPLGAPETVHYALGGTAYPADPIDYEVFFHDTLGMRFWNPTASAWQGVRI